MKNLQVAPLRARTRRCARRSGGEALGADVGVDVDVAVADLVDVAAQLWPVVAAGDVDGARQRPPPEPRPSEPVFVSVADRRAPPSVDGLRVGVADRRRLEGGRFVADEAAG